MRDITFQEVGMKNFGPYIDPMVLSFENNSLILMRGPNGIGKTMALDAIPFTCYGETSKKAKGDDVVNNRIGKNCHTWVNFTSNEDVYTVNRYHKYSKYGGNTVILNKNGVDIKKGQKEVLPEIEKILCPKKSFMNTLMFGQKVKDFFTDLIDSDKKEIFRKILDLDIYGDYYKRADELLKETVSNRDGIYTKIQVENGILEEVVRAINLTNQAMAQYELDKKEAIKGHKKSIESCDMILENWNTRLEELKQQDHNMEAITTSIASLLRTLDSTSEQRENKINQVCSQASQKEAEVSTEALKAKASLNEAYQKDVDISNESQRDFERKHKDLIDKLIREKSEITNEIGKLETTMYMNESQRSEFQTSIDSNEALCPTCLRDMDDDCISHLQDEINDITKSIERDKLKINDGKLKIDYLHKEMMAATEQMDETKAYTSKNLSEYKTIRDYQLMQVDERLKAALEKIKAFENDQKQNAIVEFESQTSQGKIEMDELLKRKDEVQKVLDRIEETETYINSVERDKLEAIKEIKKLEESEYDKSQLKSQQIRKKQLEVSIQQSQLLLLDLDSKVEIYTFWKAAFSSSGIPSMLIDEAIPFMNKQVIDYLDRMTNGRYIVSFDTLASTKAGEFRDKISVHVLDTHTGANSRVQLSGGQTRIIDIATILTLGDLQSSMQSVRFNILLFDEIFDALDDENIGYVSKVLSKMKIGKSIYIISHTHVDQLEADEVLVMH